MPCYQVNLMSVEIAASDRDLLKRALKKLGFSYTETKKTIRVQAGYQTITIEEDRATLPASLQGELNRIKKAYSEEVVEEAAQLYGWTVSEEDEYVVLRRYSPGE